MKITLAKHFAGTVEHGDQKSKAFWVYVDGRCVGHIWKQENKRGYRFPWRAYRLPRTGEATALVVGNFQPEEGGKRAAINALIEAAKS